MCPAHAMYACHCIDFANFVLLRALQEGSLMPRKLKLGRTGAKHQKPAAFDAHRQPKAEAATSRTQETLGCSK